MYKKISVKRNSNADQKNSGNFYIVTITQFGEPTRHNVHTDQHGEGLWIDGQQVEGTAQFRVGQNAAAAIRRYFARD